MDEKEGGGEGVFGAMFSVLWEVIKTVFELIVEYLPKAISFFLWVLAAVIVIPCVVIAGIIYPKWEKWGEDF